MQTPRSFFFRDELWTYSIKREASSPPPNSLHRQSQTFGWRPAAPNIKLFLRNDVGVADETRLLRIHIFSGKTPLDYSATAFLQDAPTAEGGGSGSPEIWRSPSARPPHMRREWKYRPFSKLVESLTKDGDGPLGEIIVKVKIEAILRLENAPIPKGFYDDIKKKLAEDEDIVDLLFAPDGFSKFVNRAAIDLARVARFGNTHTV